MPYLSLQSMQATRSVKHNNFTSLTTSSHSSTEGNHSTISPPPFTTQPNNDNNIRSSPHDNHEPVIDAAWSKVNIRQVVDVLIDSLQSTTQSKGSTTIDQLLDKDTDRETLVNKVWQALRDEGGSISGLKNPAIVPDTKSKSKSRSKTDSSGSVSGGDTAVGAKDNKESINHIDENKKEYKEASKIVISPSAISSIPSPPTIPSALIPATSIPPVAAITTESSRSSTRRRGDTINTHIIGKENDNVAIVSKPSIPITKQQQQQQQQQQRPNFATEIANAVKQRDVVLTATTTAVSDDRKPPLNTTIQSSIRTTSSVLRQPLRTLPVGLQEQITTTVQQSNKGTIHGSTISTNPTLGGVTDEETSRAKRWMKPKVVPNVMYVDFIF